MINITIVIPSERPKVPSARLSAEPSVVNSTEAEPLVVPTESDLRLTEKIVINSKYCGHLELKNRIE